MWGERWEGGKGNSSLAKGRREMFENELLGDERSYARFPCFSLEVPVLFPANFQGIRGLWIEILWLLNVCRKMTRLSRIGSDSTLLFFFFPFPPLLTMTASYQLLFKSGLFTTAPWYNHSLIVCCEVHTACVVKRLFVVCCPFFSPLKMEMTNSTCVQKSNTHTSLFLNSSIRPGGGTGERERSRTFYSMAQNLYSPRIQSFHVTQTEHRSNRRPLHSTDLCRVNKLTII